MLKWKLFKDQIPHQIQLNAKSLYEILWVDNFSDGKTLGEMRPDVKQIVIKTGQTPKNTVITYLHEVIHSISNEFDIGLTENQVLKCEKAIYYLLKKNNIFKGKE